MRLLRHRVVRDLVRTVSRASRPTTAAVVHEVMPELTVSIVDVGARWGSTDAWYRVPPLGRVFGFEPDAQECARLNSVSTQGERYVPVALGAADGDATLYITREPACSSLLPPDPDVVTRYPLLAPAQLAREVRVPLRRLDGVARAERVERVHVMKLDTQGTELDVVRGAGSLVDGVLAAEVEVELNPIYRGQPLLGDVDRELRAHGLCLWRFRTLQHYAEHDVAGGVVEVRKYDHRTTRTAAGAGRIYWADAVFFRDPAGVDDVDDLARLASLFDALGESDGLVTSLTKLCASPRLGASQRAKLDAHRRRCESRG